MYVSAETTGRVGGGGECRVGFRMQPNFQFSFPFLFDTAKIRKISEICKFFGCFFMVLSAKLNIETFFKL